MTSSPAPAARPTTVVVNGHLAPAGVVQRCVERIIETVPSDASVVVFTARSTRVTGAAARRVRNPRGGHAQYVDTVGREVAGDRAVIVLPAQAVPQDSSWFSTAQVRMSSQPRLIGVLGDAPLQVFGFPRSVTSLDGPQSAWSELPGLTLGRHPRRTEHRSVGAVLIVKDEEDVLEECLRAVAPFVDEIVVYDTGSTDGTLAIARRLATSVIEGHWDDDFGAARNRALAHSTTDWVLSLDADEVAGGDPLEFRRVVDATAADGVLVSIVSTSHGYGSAGDEVRATRLFERATARWSGALHEQVVFGEEGGPVRLSTDALPLTLVHSGYSAVTMATKDKRARNLDIARASHGSALPGSFEQAEAAAHLGRALAGDGQGDAALQVLNCLLDRPAASGNNVQAARVAVPLAVQRRRWDLVESWCALGERFGEAPGQITTWRAAAMVGADRADDAAAVLDELLEGDGGEDLWGQPYDLDGASSLRAELDLVRGDAAGAATRMRRVLQRSPETVNLQVLVNALGALGLTMRDLIDEAPEPFLARALRDMTALPPSIALPWFSAHSAAAPDDFRPVVAGCAVAARSSWPDALEWSARAREAGLTGVSPLRDLAEDPARDGVERALAWALLHHGFGTDGAVVRFAAQLDDLAPVARNAALALVREVVPDIDEDFFPSAGAPQIRRRTTTR